MKLKTNKSLRDKLNGAATKREYLDILHEEFQDGRRLICSLDGVESRNCTLTGPLLDDGKSITKIGVASDTTSYLAADLSGRTGILRIQSGDNYIEGTLGLDVGAAFVIDENPTTENGIGIRSIHIDAPAHLPDGPPVAEELITTFDITNWSASPTPVLFRGGMPFKKGDVPAGSGLEILRGGVPVAAQFDERSTWSDGSLKFAVCHMRDTELAGSATRTYEVHTVAGGFGNTGNKSLGDVGPLTVEVSSLTQYDGDSSTTRGSGSALATFAAHAAVPTRVTKIHSGPVCEGWQVWGMFKDGADGSGSEDAHLKVNWYVDVWKDENGDVIDTEFAAELTQDWWAVAGKYRLDYTATLKRNGFTVQAYSGVQHPYHSRWVTVQTQDDNNHARRHWSGSTPTLTYKFDREYWRQSHIVPPFDLDQTPTPAAKTMYTPLGNMQHRAGLDSSGGYMGRGLLPNCDSATFVLQTPEMFRNSRTNAFAGLGITRHFRDDRTRTREGESADIANTLIPLLWDPKPSGDSTFPGLPTPKHAYRGSHGGQTGGYQPFEGGHGVWTSSSDASHAVPYSAFAYMVDGERYFLEASIDLATANAHILNSNEFGGIPFIHWYENVDSRAEMSVPSTRYGGIPDYRGQERSLGWSAAIMSYAVSLTPDSDPQGAYLRGWAAHCGDYLETCIEYTPPSLIASGTTFIGGNAFRSPWMMGFIVQGCSQLYLTSEVGGFKDYADLASRALVALAERNLYDLILYRYTMSEVYTPYSYGNYRTRELNLQGPTEVSVTGDTLTFVSGDMSLSPTPIRNGDEMYFYSVNSGHGGASMPSEYVAGTPLYVVDASGANCKVAESPGGAPIDVQTGTFQVVGLFTGRDELTEAANPPYLPPADSYAPIAEAVFAIGETAQLPSIPPGTYVTVRAFLANVNRDAYAAWVFAPVEEE